MSRILDWILSSSIFTSGVYLENRILIYYDFSTVSTFARTPEKSLPSFKIALVVCQEVYVCSKYFPPLMAPKQDGMALISALRQLDFQVTSHLYWLKCSTHNMKIFNLYQQFSFKSHYRF